MKWFGHHETDNKPKLSTCKYCNTKFEDKEKLKRHVRNAHNVKGGTIFENFTNNLELIHHTKFICEIDQLKFKTYEELILHMRQIHHHQILKCRECGKEFIHEKDRLHHVREDHEKKIDYRKHKDSNR
ncbi:MAG: C2H2-type zinc finger protein [Nitrososphaeraceae archaeon]|nr:C2H2-type zinc finger protein [Nitrososphaeraceae archaeon]MDW3653594.1 C2H2-type zinc finger protein [Nitrososphaeraceae archaeon]